MKRIFVLFAFFFASIGLQAELPVIGDWSDVLWMRGSSDVHNPVTFDPSSKFVAGATFQIGIEIFTVPEGKRFKNYGGGNPHFLKRGKLLAYYGAFGPSLRDEVRIVDIETDSIVFRVTGERFAISPDDRTIALGGDGYVYLYDIETGQLLRTSPEIEPEATHGALVTGMFFLNDGKEMSIALYIFSYPSSFTRYYLWDLETNTITPSNLFPKAVSPDGTKLVYAGGGPGRLLTIIDAKTKQEIGYVPDEGIKSDPWGISFSPDGRYLLYTFPDGSPHPYHICIWDIEIGELVYAVPRKTLGGYSCAFSPDGKYFAIGYSIFLFDFERIKRKIEEATGVAEPEHAFFVYYNPYQIDYIRFHYRLEEPIPTTITVHDVFGRKVAEEECGWWLYTHNGEYGIPASYFPSGVYFVTIASGGKIVTQKFLVTH